MFQGWPCALFTMYSVLIIGINKSTSEVQKQVKGVRRSLVQQNFVF